MHDEFRVQAHTKSPGALIEALKDVQDGGSSPRVAVTHEGDHVFLYADSLPAAEQAGEVVRRALQAARHRGGRLGVAVAPGGGALGGRLRPAARDRR